MDIGFFSIAVLSLCRKLDVLVAMHSPGFVAGSVKSPNDFHGKEDYDHSMPWVSVENLNKYLVLME